MFPVASYHAEHLEDSAASCLLPSAGYDLTQARRYGVSEACTTPCTGNPDATCGGPNANQVYTIPPPPPPSGTANYTYLGCYTDDQVFDTAQEPPMPMRRRELPTFMF